MKINGSLKHDRSHNSENQITFYFPCTQHILSSIWFNFLHRAPWVWWAAAPPASPLQSSSSAPKFDIVCRLISFSLQSSMLHRHHTGHSKALLPWLLLVWYHWLSEGNVRMYNVWWHCPRHPGNTREKAALPAQGGWFRCDAGHYLII